MTMKIRGLELGSGAPKVIVSIMGADEVAILHRAERIVAAGADICEWRVDQFSDPSAIETVLPQLRAVLDEMPLLATVRSAAEGGAAQLSAAQLVDLTERLCATGDVDLLDVEAQHDGASASITAARARGVPVIASQHVLDQCPSRDEVAATFERLARLDVQAAKLAVTARSASEVADLLGGCAQASEQLSKPLIAIAMGEVGKVSRAAGHVFGSAATFASLDQEASAPGQLDIAALRKMLDWFA